MAKLSAIEGIGDTYASRLKETGITTIENLLEVCCEKMSRHETAEKTGISESLLLEWVNRADLSRIKGVSTQYADLLEASGVDSVPELAQRNAENLHAKMTEINDSKNLVRKIPALSQVHNWIEQAKSLPRLVSH